MNHYETVFILNPVLSDTTDKGNSKEIRETYSFLKEQRWYRKKIGG